MVPSAPHSQRRGKAKRSHPCSNVCDPSTAPGGTRSSSLSPGLIPSALDARTQAFPVLTAAQIDRVLPIGKVRQVQRGEILFEPVIRMALFSFCSRVVWRSFNLIL